MEALKFRKVHVDSRMKSSGTHSSFSFDLKETFDTPEGTVCYCDNALIPHSWQTVTATKKKRTTKQKYERTNAERNEPTNTRTDVLSYLILS